MSTSLRRDPDDPRGLGERIEAVVTERLEEAVEFVCMDLLVQLRRAQGRPAPVAKSASDRQEFQGLVREWLLHLRGALLDGLLPEEVRKVGQAEEARGREEIPRLLAGQVALARALPDYWQRFETLRAAFAQARLTTRPRRSRLWPFRRRPASP
ncbi:MAG: hypothetical protein AABZ20_09170 [candidate division NC10 bacterium]